ncbi:unnamed protein product [Bubo scandiacus]
MGDPEVSGGLGEGDLGVGLAPPPGLAPAPAEVEVTWQEILSLSELQGLDMAADTSFDPPLPSPLLLLLLLTPLSTFPSPPSPPSPFHPPFPPLSPTPPTNPPFPRSHPPTQRLPGRRRHPRDARRALALTLPIGPEAIVNLPVEDFNALLGRARLSGAELALARDIRRRGKNKVAAQKCRQRKLEAIARLQAELGRLGRERERLLRARGQAERALGALRRDLARVSAQVLGALRDGAGNSAAPRKLRAAPGAGRGLSLESPGEGE